MWKHNVPIAERLQSSLVNICLLVSITMLSACASTRDAAIHAEASGKLNRDTRGQSLSVAVKVYQLRSDQAFSRLTIEAIGAGKPDQALLSPDLISVRDMTLLPGGKVDLTDFVLAEDAKYVGIVGMFRQPDRHFWRLLFDAEDVLDDDLQVRAEDCYLVAVRPKASPLPGQSGSASPSCR